ncbi:PREDICTED: mammaglobin-A-like isoform X2 [Myotis davidii]|uniref:mammaglobin-A-like isoform X2 n=1 Tax=Myotis davidii TaxID=225400 RepID=UPI000767AEBC|nr:PREDICTED: mammaglobin-A-like isoform X2 [Myotis davidii]
MKLVVVLMLSALPLSCYAGSGCELLEEVIYKTIDPTESTTQYIDDLQPLIPGEVTEKALTNLKQCFLDQDQETLNLVSEMMVMAVTSSCS